MPPRTLLLAAMLSVAPLAAMAADDVIDASDPGKIVAIAKAYGDAKIDTGAGGNPQIRGRIGELPYEIFFASCDSGTCEDLNFYAGFKDAKLTLDAINDWNRDKRFGSAYLDSELDAAIEFDLNLQYGVTRANLDAAFGIWSLLVPQFADYIDFRR